MKDSLDKEHSPLEGPARALGSRGQHYTQLAGSMTKVSRKRLDQSKHSAGVVSKQILLQYERIA